MTAATESRYGLWLARHARSVVVLWLLAVVLAFCASLGVVGGGLFSRLQQKEPYVASESNTGNQHLLTGPDAGGTVIVRLDGVPTTRQGTLGPALQRSLTSAGHVAQVASAFSPAAKDHPEAAAPYRSPRAPTSLVYVVTLDAGLTKAQQEHAADILLTLTRHDAGSGVTVRDSGSVPVTRDITGQVEKDLRTGESIAMPLTLIVMVLVFGGFVAAGIPLVGAVASIAGGLLNLLGFS